MNCANPEAQADRTVLPTEFAIQSVAYGNRTPNLTELEHLASAEYRIFVRRASRYLNNFHDAEDAVQDALLSAYQHLAAFKNESKLSSWLTTIVINAARVQLRRRKPNHSYEQLVESQENPALVARVSQDNRPSPEEIQGCNELNALLVTFVDQLSPIYRRAVYLFYFHGLNTADASGVLGIPVPTFKARLRRAREQLRKRIQGTIRLKFRKAPFEVSR